MKRAIIQVDKQYVKWIGWTAGIFPTIPPIYQVEDITEAMVVTTEYLEYRVDKDKTRKELIKQTYPHAKFLEVELTVKGELE